MEKLIGFFSSDARDIYRALAINSLINNKYGNINGN